MDGWDCDLSSETLECRVGGQEEPSMATFCCKGEDKITQREVKQKRKTRGWRSHRESTVKGKRAVRLQ